MSGIIDFFNEQNEKADFKLHASFLKLYKMYTIIQKYVINTVESCKKKKKSNIQTCSGSQEVLH